MAAYVDNAAIPFRGKPRHHLTADSLAELHAFASSIGVSACWFHRGAKHLHYDVTDADRLAAIAAGAVEVNSRELVQIAYRMKRRP